ncbi:MAG: hypothetical protein HWN67_12170, partial [Candidatus Helarchaeota archaeon]|nr:hypothetical protein [Candidatus Helarchaeota archaeon]
STANGTAICTAAYTQRYVQLCSDGAGGAIITWDDSRGTSRDIYAQRVNSSGGMEWTGNGIAITTENNLQVSPQLCSDGAGGAIITWDDRRVDGISTDIYVQRVNSSGGVEWAANGTAICTATDNQYYVQLCSDGAGGAIITWEDYRTSGTVDIYAQIVSSDGNIKRATDGMVICNAGNNQRFPQICKASLGGTIISWQDYRDGNWDVYAQLMSLDIFPTSNCPEDIITTTSGSETIDWVLYDDIGSGQYKVWVNDSDDNFHIWIDWTLWTNNSHIIVPINYNFLGTFNYTIEYNDSRNQFSSDTVMVTIVSSKPSESPNIFMGPQGTGDISEFLLSPFGLGIIIGIITAFSIMTAILIKNNKIIKENSKKIKEVHNNIGKITSSKADFKNTKKRS